MSEGYEPGPARLSDIVIADHRPKFTLADAVVIRTDLIAIVRDRLISEFGMQTDDEYEEQATVLVEMLIADGWVMTSPA